MGFKCFNLVELNELLKVLSKMGYNVTYPTSEFNNLVITDNSGSVKVFLRGINDTPIHYMGERKVMYQDTKSFIICNKSDKIPDFPNGAKFLLNNMVEANFVQEKLLAAGYYWPGVPITEMRDTTNSKHYIVANPLGKNISWYMYSPTPFKETPYPQFRIELSATLTEIEKPKVVETIEIDGKKYSKEALKERIKNLEEVK